MRGITMHVKKRKENIKKKLLRAAKEFQIIGHQARRPRLNKSSGRPFCWFRVWRPVLED